MSKGLWTDLSQKVTTFVKKIDPSSWPAFFMFAVVLAAAGGLNYSEMAKIVHPLIALLIAMLFGVGVLAWHVVESRTDDSEYQEDVAQFAKWLNAILDGALLVVNLFRAEFASTTYDVVAFAIIGVSSASHVVAYLLWTQNDPRRLTRKALERGLSDVNQRADRANIAIQRTAQEMAKRKWVEDEAIALRKTYSNTPGIDVERMIRDMKETALKEFENVKPQDLEKTNANNPHVQQLVTNQQTVDKVDFTKGQKP